MRDMGNCSADQLPSLIIDRVMNNERIRLQMDGEQNETEKTGDTTIRETGHDARSDANERSVQRTADQAEARAGTLLPEETPKDGGHMPDGDKAGPQAGQEHAAEGEGVGMAKLAHAEQTIRDPLVGKSQDYLGYVKQHDPLSEHLSERNLGQGDGNASGRPAPTRPQVARDHQVILDYVLEYVDWKFAQLAAARA